MEVETWIKIEGGRVVHRVMLNETYGIDEYDADGGEQMLHIICTGASSMFKEDTGYRENIIIRIASMNVSQKYHHFIT